MEFLKEYVPESFRNVIISVSFEPNLHFHSVIRANINNINDCDLWVSEFGRNTKTKWNLRNSKPTAQRLVCRKKFVCQHSNFQKRPNDALGRKSKNYSCQAFINIRVKLTTTETKKKDKYLRDGLPAVITMNNYHSHDIVSSVAMSYLPPSDEVRISFESYFNDGLGIREAIKVHEAKLELLGFDDLTDASINPRYDTVKYWLSNWRKTNVLPEQKDNEIDSDQSPGCSGDNDEHDLDSGKDNVYENKPEFQELIALMQLHNSRFGTSSGLLQKVIKRLKVVNSKTGWNAFLNSAGSNLLVHKRHRNKQSCRGTLKQKSSLYDALHQDSSVDNPLYQESSVDNHLHQETFLNNRICKDVSTCSINLRQSIKKEM